MNKSLVVYFSASGITKKVAENLANIVKGDLFEIVPIQKYTDEDLDWTNKNSRSSIEMQEELTRPEIKQNVQNISSYNTIFIGFPVWWNLAPRIINTFIEQNDLSNKKVYIFVTSGGSAVNVSFENLQQQYKDINFVSGKKLSTTTTSNEIESWIN